MKSKPVQADTIIKPRIEYIDLLRCFAIFSVMWFHSIGDFRTGNSMLTDPVFKFPLIYNMPLFFMISGFFFSSYFDLSFKEVLRKRFAALIIPHIAWSLIIALTNWGMTFVGWERPFRDQPFSILSEIHAFFMPDPATELWFFRDLFLTDVIVFISCKIFNKRYIAFIVSMLFVLLFSFFGVVGKIQRFMMPIFWSGILLKTYYPIFCKHLNKILIISGMSFLVCFYFYNNAYMIYLMDFPPLINFQQLFAGGSIVFDFTNIGIAVFRLLAGLVGSIFFFALFQRCWKKNAVTSVFSRCGQLTVGIYGIQSILLQRVMHNTLDFVNVNIWIYRLIITPITAVFVLFVSVLIISLIQRNKRLTFMLFGSSLVNRGFVRHETKSASS